MNTDGHGLVEGNRGLEAEVEQTSWFARSSLVRVRFIRANPCPSVVKQRSNWIIRAREKAGVRENVALRSNRPG